MNEYWLGLFLLFWALTDRMREIAVFPGWVSALGGWFDTFHNKDITTLWMSGQFLGLLFRKY